MINEAIGLSGVYDELGIPMTIVLQLDSTAAIGMIQRRGTGRAPSVICSCKSDFVTELLVRSRKSTRLSTWQMLGPNILQHPGLRS